MSMSLPVDQPETPTITVEDTQPTEMWPDNQLGLTQATQEATPTPVESLQHESQPILAQPVGLTLPAAIPETMEYVDGANGLNAAAGGGADGHAASPPGQVIPPAGGPAAAPLEQGIPPTHGADASPPIAPEFAPSRDEKKKDEEMAPAPDAIVSKDPEEKEDSQIVRQNAFLEEDSDDQMMECKKCGLPLSLAEGVIRGPTQVWCKQCHALDTLLRRHQAWPPALFSRLSDGEQQEFWRKCKKDHDANGRFSYQRVRDVLCTSLMSEVRREKMVGVGGTYLPLSVYRARGYEIDAGFEERNPCKWSDGLGQYTYLLAEVSICEKEIHATVEREVAEAERAVKKRKTKKEPAEAPAVEDAKPEESETVDLLTESEGEGEVKRIKPDGQEAGQSEEGLSGKQLQAKLKREANKLQKEEQKKAKKEEAARKREAQANTKKVVQLSSKLSVPLTQAVHKAHEILQKADALGLKEIEEVKEFQACVEVIEDWKKKCSSALNFYAKNPNCELAALPFTKDKDVFTSLKELAKKGTELKTMVLNPAQKEQSTKK